MVALWMPYDQPSVYITDKPMSVATEIDIPLQPTLQDFVSLWGRELRSPLIDPPVEVPPETAADANTVIVARPDLRLVGYTVEADAALAILMGRLGSVEFIAVGDELDGVTVVSISSEGVLLDHNGEEYTLKLDDESLGPSPEIQDARRVDRSGYGVGGYR